MRQQAQLMTQPLGRRQLLRLAGLGALSAAGVALLSACGSSGGGSGKAGGANPTSATGGGAAATVTMTDQLKFEPADLTIAKGTTVTWKNSGQLPHTATDDPGKAIDKAHAALPSGAQPWDSGNVNVGQSWSHTFDVPGKYAYFCIPHEAAGMIGTITVTG